MNIPIATAVTYKVKNWLVIIDMHICKYSYTAILRQCSTSLLVYNCCIVVYGSCYLANIRDQCEKWYLKFTISGFTFKTKL